MRPCASHVPRLQDSRSRQSSPDPAGASRQRRARQQRRGADDLPVAGGRYCVLDAKHRTWWRHSPQDHQRRDRKKLKEIANEIEVPQGAGLIVRTAGAKRTKTEIKRDYEYLQRLWEQIRELTLKSIAPAKIYEEGDLIKRSIRDLYNARSTKCLLKASAAIASPRTS